MTKRERALQIAADAIEQIENGSITPDVQESLGYAVVLLLADIGQRLEDLDDTLGIIYSDGIGVGK